MNQYIILKRVQVVVSRSDANFDRACDEAQKRAVIQLNVDEDGHIKGIDAPRSEIAILVKFESYVRTCGMAGHSHDYIFSAYVEQNCPEPFAIED